MKIQKKTRAALALALAFAVVFAFAACSSGGGDSETNGLATVTEGKLTIATGEPAYEPWVLNDDPASGEGFEAAVAYAIAEQLGFAKEDVIWVRTQFDEAISPGPKDFDFNLQQYSITTERKEVVDFSPAYYHEAYVVITKADSKFASATSLADLKDAVFASAAGDVSIQVTEQFIDPTNEVQIYNNLYDAFSALNSGQVDACVTGLLTADYVVNIEQEQIENGVVVGQIVGSEDFTEGTGLLLPKDSELTEAITAAIEELWANGTLQALTDKWLTQYDVKPLS
jgi:polar amino acid transport system substrate-binding protein